MKVFIVGGSGFIGSHMSSLFLGKGWEVTIMARNPKGGHSLPEKVNVVAADATKPGQWQDKASQHDVIINLAGVSVFHRWNEDYKRLLRDSRVLTTRNVVDAIPSDAAKTVTLINGSGAGYYGLSQDQIIDETCPPGTDFLGRLAYEWEEEAIKAERKDARVVRFRTGIVLGHDGGALSQMVLPFRFFAGGPVGDGQQWISWIHIEDICNAALFVIENENVRGPLNLTAPVPIRNADMAKAIGRIMKRPSFIPAPSFMIKLMLGEFGQYILKGQRVVPKALLDSGFTFKFSTIDEALRNLL